MLFTLVVFKSLLIGFHRHVAAFLFAREVFGVLRQDVGVLLTRFYKRLEDPEQTLQQERDMLHLLLRVLVWIVWIRLENLGAHVGVDLAQTLVQEAPDAGEVAVRSFEVLRYGVYPVVGLRLRFARNNLTESNIFFRM